MMQKEKTSSKRPRIVRPTKNKAVLELSKAFSISYGYAFKLYIDARNYRRVFNDKSILQLIEESLYKVEHPEINAYPVNPFIKN